MIDQEIALFADWSNLSRFITGDRIADPIGAGEIALKLRRLLLDSKPLIHLVNKNKRFKIHFPTENESFDNISHSTKVVGNIKTNDVGQILKKDRIVLKNHSQFLNHTILIIEKESYSVKNIISLIANNLGGVHFDQNHLDNKISFDPNYKNNSIALILSICTIAKMVSIGIRELAESCSPFPHYSEFISHHTADPGVVDFDPNQYLAGTYDGKIDGIESFAIYSVLELKPQLCESSVFYTLQDGPDSEVLKISFSYLGDLIIDLNWNGAKICLKMLDEGKLRPVGKLVFLAVRVEAMKDSIKLSCQINDRKSAGIVLGKFGAVVPYRSVLAADREGKNGAAVRISEMMILKSSDESYLKNIEKYAYYRYSLAS